MLLKLPNGAFLSVAAIIGVGIVRPFKRLSKGTDGKLTPREGWKFLYSVEGRDFTIEGVDEKEVAAARAFMVDALVEYHRGTPWRGIEEHPVREMPAVAGLATDTMQQA